MNESSEQESSEKKLSELNELFGKVKNIEDAKRGLGSRLFGSTSSTALHPFLFNLIKNNCIEPDDESIYYFVNNYIADSSNKNFKSDLISKIISYDCVGDKKRLLTIQGDLFKGDSRKRKHKRKFTRRKRKSRIFNTGISYR